MPERGEAREGDDIVVFMVRSATQCSECERELGPGNLLRKEDEKGLCMDCADLGHLEFLGPPGDRPGGTERAQPSSLSLLSSSTA